jgi:hypothetical protein
MIDMNDKNSVSVILIQEIMIDMNDKNSASRPRPRPGTASEARPSPFTNFTSGPPLVHPLSRLRFSLTFNAGLNP